MTLMGWKEKREESQEVHLSEWLHNFHYPIGCDYQLVLLLILFCSPPEGIPMKDFCLHSKAEISPAFQLPKTMWLPYNWRTSTYANMFWHKTIRNYNPFYSWMSKMNNRSREGWCLLHAHRAALQNTKDPFKSYTSNHNLESQECLLHLLQDLWTDWTWDDNSSALKRYFMLSWIILLSFSHFGYE